MKPAILFSLDANENQDSGRDAQSSPAGRERAAGNVLDIRALVVAGDEIQRQQLVGVVSELVAQVDEAAGGAEAVLLFEEHGHPVVFLDLQLPDGQGMEILRRIRAPMSGGEPGSQVILLSDQGGGQDVIEALNLHAFRYLDKPVAEEDIERALCEAYELTVREVGGRAPEHAYDELEAEIQALYARLAGLSERRTQAPEDDALRREYEVVFQCLRQAQQFEAVRARAVFRAHLGLMPGQGARSLQAAREELVHGTSESIARSCGAAEDAT